MKQDAKMAATMFQMAINDKLGVVLKDFTVDEIRDLTLEIIKPDFGKTGNYNFMCSSCGGSWNFETKEKRDFFRKFHNAAGCSYEQKTVDNRITLVRAKTMLSDNAIQAINKVIAHKSPTKENNPELQIEAEDLVDAPPVAVEDAQVIEETTNA
jgi:hypothetical protein